MKERSFPQRPTPTDRTHPRSEVSHWVLPPSRERTLMHQSGVHPTSVMRGAGNNLPDGAGVFSDHGVAAFAVECTCELGHVRERAVDAPAGERVRVCGDLQALGFGRVFSRPDLPPAEEETLLIGETFDRRW